MYCFRFVPRFGVSLSEAELNELNQRIVDETQPSGKAFLMTTAVRGKTAVRFSITDYRTTEDDVKITFDTLRQMGNRLFRSTYGDGGDSGPKSAPSSR